MHCKKTHTHISRVGYTLDLVGSEGARMEREPGTIITESLFISGQYILILNQCSRKNAKTLK